MQIDVSATPNTTAMSAVANDNGAYDVPRGLVLALNGAEEARAAILAHLRDTGQVQPGDVIDTNWPAE